MNLAISREIFVETLGFLLYASLLGICMGSGVSINNISEECFTAIVRAYIYYCRTQKVNKAHKTEFTSSRHLFLLKDYEMDLIKLHF